MDDTARQPRINLWLRLKAFIWGIRLRLSFGSGISWREWAGRLRTDCPLPWATPRLHRSNTLPSKHLKSDNQVKKNYSPREYIILLLFFFWFFGTVLPSRVTFNWRCLWRLVIREIGAAIYAKQDEWMHKLTRNSLPGSQRCSSFWTVIQKITIKLGLEGSSSSHALIWHNRMDHDSTPTP